MSKPSRDGEAGGARSDGLAILGGVKPLHVVLLAGLVWLLRNASPIVVEVRLADSRMVGAPPSQIVNSAPAVALPPTNISDSGVAPRRKYTYADYMSLLQVAPLYATTADPVIADILAAHDIRNDAAYKENIEESQNKERMYGPFIQRGFEGDQRLYIAWTGPERGFGAFAEVGIPTGTPIGIYTGIVTNQSVGSRYSWHYNSDNEIKDEEGNPIGLSLDAWHNGNHLRFVNHDEQPNCNVEMIPYNNLWHVLYVTTRAIKPDEELTVSYGSGYWSGRQHELKTGYTENDGAQQPAAAQQSESQDDDVETVVETVTV